MGIVIKKNIFTINSHTAFSFYLSTFTFITCWLVEAQNYLFNKICFNLFISDIQINNQFGIQAV